MSRALLSFDLPEDEDRFKASVFGPALVTAIFEFDQHLRRLVKDSNEDDRFVAGLDEARIILRENLDAELAWVLTG